MCLAFFHAERSLVLMTLLTTDRLEQIHQALKNQYARHESKLPVILCFYDSRCFSYCIACKKCQKIENLKVIDNRK